MENKVGFSIEKDQIYIQIPDKVHNHFGICIYLKNKSTFKILKFKSLVKVALNNFKLRWFLQGGSNIEQNEWCCFDIWENVKEVDQNLIFQIAEQIAIMMEMDFEIE